jgi:hypothetical protein
VNVYELGDAILLTSDFANVNGLPFNPYDVTLWVKDPTGTETTYTTGFTNPAVGQFTYETAPVTISGVWFYKWNGSGNTNVSTADYAFRVNASSLIAG